jgi:hypothetical protein
MQFLTCHELQEFHPYVFQIFAQLIELRTAPLPELYMTIFKPLLAPLFWERPGNVPALTRLLQAYLIKAGPQIAQQGLLEVCTLPTRHCMSKAWHMMDPINSPVQHLT